MVGRHHRFNGHEFEQIPGDSEGQEACVLQSMEWKRVGKDSVTEQQQQIIYIYVCVCVF